MLAREAGLVLGRCTWEPGGLGAFDCCRRHDGPGACLSHLHIQLITVPVNVGPTGVSLAAKMNCLLLADHDDQFGLAQCLGPPGDGEVVIPRMGSAGRFENHK